MLNRDVVRATQNRQLPEAYDKVISEFYFKPRTQLEDNYQLGEATNAEARTNEKKTLYEFFRTDEAKGQAAAVEAAVSEAAPGSEKKSLFSIFKGKSEERVPLP